MPTLEEIRQMADKQAAPLLEKLKTDPKNPELLAQVGALYHAAHQFKESAGYYARAVEADPKNPALRIKMAASTYRSGDSDGAISQLNAVLKTDPKNPEALFNLGVIRAEGKQDPKGAAEAWRQLLKLNPGLPAQRKQLVEKLLAQANGTPQQKGAAGNGAQR